MAGTKKVLWILAGSVIVLPGHTHHNPASHYDLEKSITVDGVVMEFRLINPHARIYFEVTTADGVVQAWLAEGNASSILKRRGWKDDSLKIGDAITISGNPARDGGPKLDWKLIVLPDGTEMHGGNTVAAERERQLDALDDLPRR